MANRLHRLTEHTFSEWTEQRRHQTLFVGVVANSCVQAAPLESMLEDIEDSHDRRVAAALIDFDQSAGLAKRFNVDAVPSLLVFKDGQLAGQFINKCT
jgi:thioredoxin-like negative regulator of GroEL